MSGEQAGGLDPRVTGEQAYSVDVVRPGMLHAAFVRSPHPHARVIRVDASGLPAGSVVLGPDDVSGLGRYGCQARDQRVLADVARHAGDVVAAVAAPTRAAARAAARRIRVDYEELPAVFDAVQAVAPGAPLLHADAAESAQEAVSIGVRPIAGTNVCHRFRLVSGDAAAAMRTADVVISEAFRTPSAAHVPMEPHAAVAEWAGDAAHALDRHPDAVQPARRPRGPVRPRAGGRPDRGADDGRLVRRQDVRADGGGASPRSRARRAAPSRSCSTGRRSS